jgi:hypothetical protein
MPERSADKVRRVSRSELSHRDGAMTFEGPGTDLHPQGALLVRITFADEIQDLALTFGQRLLTRC